MWFFLFVCTIGFVRVSANADEDVMVLHKCCPENAALKKVTDSESSIDIFECVDIKTAEESFNITIAPLIIGQGVKVEYGLPRQCGEMQMVGVASTDLNIRLKSFVDQCYDRLEIEVSNDTLQTHIPKIVEIICVRNDSLTPSFAELALNQFRKCCPIGQSYDRKLHLCRNTSEDSSETWLLQQLRASDSAVFEVGHTLTCKLEEFAVELSEISFSLDLNGSQLKVTKIGGTVTETISSGQWCVDREFTDHKLVARVCTRDCGKYGALCTKKCCPLGYHFQPRRCDTFISICVPNSDLLPFNVTEYTDPLEKDYPHISDIMGIGNGLHCDHKRIVLDKSAPRDRHWLYPDGRLYSPVSFGFDYCLESFDRRNCPNGEITVTAVNCFVKPPELKDFRISFVLISISSVCLALTLLVYLSLPELRNLHGRTLTCHVSMMLLAFCCLARVQYSYIPGTVCTLLGYGVYFGFVAAFAWLNVMCFDIWWTFGSVRNIQPMRKASAELRRFIWYSVYAWSFAIVLTSVMFLFDRYPVADFLDAEIGVGMCWFGTLQNTKWDWPHYIYFVIPMGLLSCTNFILWVLTARHCARVKSEVHRLQAGSIGDRAKRRFRMDRAKYILTGKLWIVMGAGWISELLSTLTTEPQWLWNVFDLINELQGVLIFLILVIKPKLYYLVRKRLGLEKPDAQKNATSSSTRTSSTFLSRTTSSDERALTRLSLQNNGKQS